MKCGKGENVKNKTNDLMKILVGLVIFNRVIFKDLKFDCYCKNSISQ